MMKIGFIGCGVYALALSKIFKISDCDIVMWSKFESEIRQLEKEYDYIEFTNDLGNIVNMDLVVIAIPSSFILDTLEEFKKYYTKEDVLIASKGILRDGTFISDAVSKILNTRKVSVISGPTFAVDIESRIPLGLSLGCLQDSSVSLIKNVLETDYLELEVIHDVKGIEFCGSIKNVMAISTGMIEGLGYPESTRYKYLTKIIREMVKVISLFGGNPLTVNSYAGIGDLLLTSTCSKSRNYSFGVVVGKNENIEEYLKQNTTEGYYTLGYFYNLCRIKNINIDIINILYEIIYQKGNLDRFIEYIKR